MKLFAVLATGPSMSQEIADKCRGRCGIIAVNDAYRLAPFADALVANDRSWWKAHPEALKFPGRKFSGIRVEGAEHLKATLHFPSGSNSGFQGMRVAWQVFGAERILLCGFDMKGSHFFGPHPAPLKNTAPERFQKFIKRCSGWIGCEVINCTPGSALKAYPFKDLDEALCAR